MMYRGRDALGRYWVSGWKVRGVDPSLCFGRRWANGWGSGEID